MITDRYVTEVEKYFARYDSLPGPFGGIKPRGIAAGSHPPFPEMMPSPAMGCLLLGRIYSYLGDRRTAAEFGRVGLEHFSPTRGWQRGTSKGLSLPIATRCSATLLWRVDRVWSRAWSHNKGMKLTGRSCHQERCGSPAAYRRCSTPSMAEEV